jgi:hypothetical protein
MENKQGDNMRLKINDKVIITRAQIYSGYEATVVKANEFSTVVRFDYMGKTIVKKYKLRQLEKVESNHNNTLDEQISLLDKFAMSAMNAIIIGTACEQRYGDSYSFWHNAMDDNSNSDRSVITENAYDIAYSMLQTRLEYINKIKNT